MPDRVETIALDSPQCPSYGLGLKAFPGTQDSEVVEIEVQAYRRPSHRLLQDLTDWGLKRAYGTLAGGLKALAPLFEPMNQAPVAKLRSASHWHADETRWALFVNIEGKVGHRWQLWVFHSAAVVHYVLDPSRATSVIEDTLGPLDSASSAVTATGPASASRG